MSYVAFGLVESADGPEPAVAIAWGTQLAAPIYADGDNAVHTQKAFGGGKHKGYSVAAHRGAIWVRHLMLI